MFEQHLPARANIHQYKKQAKELTRDANLGNPDALHRLQRNHPRFHKLSGTRLHAAQCSLTDAQLVLAREHGFESWPKFAAHIETLRIIEAVADLKDPVAAFIEVACIPRNASHNSGTLEHAEMILAKYPAVATSSIYTAAILADEATVRAALARDPQSAARPGGHYNWDPLTYLCFSRYLRLDPARSEAFVATAKALLEAGAPAQTGWYEMIDQPTPRPILESTMYAVAGIAQHPDLTRLLLAHGADPNDGETPYHVPETYDNTVLQILLESGKLNADSLGCIALRKADWHDQEGMALALAHGADPNRILIWGVNTLHQALRRDNALSTIMLLLDHGADPSIQATHDGLSAVQIAARRGRGDVLNLLEQRDIPISLQGIDQLLAACAKANDEAIAAILAANPQLQQQLIAHGGTFLAQFAGNGNAEGLRRLLDLGISPVALTLHGDGYFDIAPSSTALHVAAWRGHSPAAQLLIDRGTPINALDGQGRTALYLAVKACIDSYWKSRRTPESVVALLKAGANTEGIEIPTGYDAIDRFWSQLTE